MSMASPTPNGATVHGGDRAGVVCTVDRRATTAGVAALRTGGTAADAAIAANAVLAVTSPHLCGMGGDLWAIVHEPRNDPVVLDATGRAGSGVDADRLRARGLTHLPLRGDVVSVSVPGCVDGWLALSERFGRLARDELLAPAIALADDGFAASPLLSLSAVLVDHLGVDGIGAALREGDLVRRPGVASALRAIARDGRDGFYRGQFGRGLLRIGVGVFTPGDLERAQADWRAAAALDVFGRRVWTAPPASQGYLILAILHVAEQLELPLDETDPEWLRTLVGAAVATGSDRPAMLHEHADPAELLASSRLARWVEATRRGPHPQARPPDAPGDTTYLCVRDPDGLAVSLIQSNAMDYGAHVVEPDTGVFLHNRGIGFSLEPGHPAELTPGRRPPSTLSPVVVTGDGGALVAVAGTMGGDSQPQLMAQHLCRLLHAGIPPDLVLDEPRWVLGREGDRGFDLWSADAGRPGSLVTDDEGLARWAGPAEAVGLRPTHQARSSPVFGHAQLIARTEAGWVGSAEPRVQESEAAVTVH